MHVREQRIKYAPLIIIMDYARDPSASQEKVLVVCPRPNKNVHEANDAFRKKPLHGRREESARCRGRRLAEMIGPMAFPKDLAVESG
jgi:hypothetical protein